MTKDGWKVLAIMSSVAGLILTFYLLISWGHSQTRCMILKDKNRVDSTKYVRQIDSLINYIQAEQIVDYWKEIKVPSCTMTVIGTSTVSSK